MKLILLLIIAALITIQTSSQNVGIGTNTPTEKLEVNGAIKIGTTAAATAGTIRWNNGKNDFEGFNGKSWVSLTGGKSAWGSQASFS
ncbi:MAG: hypothetical protein H7Y31_12585, partial [Chitinophagaceae bacterium]|nr:hypothetical protein [Chitinophagaceae bacterium]